MQKVEGSNPFSRSREGLHLQVFFRGNRFVRPRRKAPIGHRRLRRERLESRQTRRPWRLL
jgi:hypothetical protein